jgi:hypothetical protein
MKRLVVMWLVIALIIGITPSHVFAQNSESCAKAETLASYPHGNFLENLIVEADGRVLFTSYIAKRIESYRPGEQAKTFAQLPVHPISVLPLTDGYVLAAHEKSFLDGPAFLNSNQIVVLDKSGKLRKSILVPEAKFLNGMLQLPNGNILVADSVLGRIWSLDIAQEKIDQWLETAEMKPDPSNRDPRPGVNGLKFSKGKLLFSNSFSGKIWEVRVSKTGEPVGPVKLAYSLGRVDDFIIDGQSGVIAATHSDTVLKARKQKPLETVLAGGGDGSTAVAYTNATRKAIYVLTSGKLLEGGKAPARLLRVDLTSNKPSCSEQ